MLKEIRWLKSWHSVLKLSRISRRECCSRLISIDTCTEWLSCFVLPTAIGCGEDRADGTRRSDLSTWREVPCCWVQRDFAEFGRKAEWSDRKIDVQCRRNREPFLHHRLHEDDCQVCKRQFCRFGICLYISFGCQLSVTELFRSLLFVSGTNYHISSAPSQLRVFCSRLKTRLFSLSQVPVKWLVVITGHFDHLIACLFAEKNATTCCFLLAKISKNEM